MRKITFDFIGEGEGPLRGDILKTSRSIYYVVLSRPVKRRVAAAYERRSLAVLRLEEVEPKLLKYLAGSAERRPRGQQTFEMVWNKRRPKRRSFEALMRGER